MQTPTALQVSTSRLMRWGRDNAQLLGVGLAIVGAILYVGGKFQQLQNQREVFEARIEAVRAEAKQQKAEAIQKCNEKFSMYGYAAVYKAFQEKSLGKQAPTDSSD